MQVSTWSAERRKEIARLKDKILLMMDWKERYSRQIMLPELGEEGQKRLLGSSVLVVGTGGLGSPIATYLCAAGVGRIGLIDADTVSVSNLQRQVLYSEEEVGMSKVACAAKKLGVLNSDVKIECFDCRLEKDNAEDIISRFDIVADACDNFATRFLVNDCCLRLGKPYVYGSIHGLRGQVSVFGIAGKDGRMHSYRDLYDESELLSMPAPTKEVLGVTPAVTGSVEALQVLQILGQFGDPLIGRLWTVDLTDMSSMTVEL